MKLKDYAEKGVFEDGTRITAWGKDSATVEEFHAARAAASARAQELRARIAEAKAAAQRYTTERKEHVAALKQYAKDVALYAKGRLGAMPVDPGELPPEPDADIAELTDLYDEERRIACAKPAAPLGESIPPYILKLAKLAPDAEVTLDTNSRQVFVNLAPPLRGRYYFHVSSWSTDPAPWKPCKFMAQPLTEKEGYGAIQSNGGYCWRTDGHRYIFSSAAPPVGCYSFGGVEARDARAVPDPEVLIRTHAPSHRAVAVGTVEASCILKAVRVVAAASPADAPSVILAVRGAGDSAVLSLLSQPDADGTFSELPIEADVTNLSGRETYYMAFSYYYLKDVLVAFGRGSVTVALFELTGEFEGTMYLEREESGVQRGAVLMCVSIPDDWKQVLIGG